MSPVSEVSPYLYLDVFIWEGRLARFPRSRLIPLPRCVHMTGRAGSVPEISVFSNRALGKRARNFSIWLFIPVTGMKAGWILAQMASPCIACCIFRIISIPVNCSDTALRVAKAMLGAKVIIFVFRMSALFVPLCQNSSPGSRTFSSSRKPGWNFSYEPKAKLVSVTRLIWRGRKSRGTSETGLRLQAYVSANRPRDFK